MTLASSRGAVESYFRAWNVGDFSALEDVIAPEWVDHSHPDRHNAADVRRAFEAAREQWPETQVLVDAVLGDADIVTVNGRVVTGDRTENRVWIIRTVEGRLHEMWSHAVD